MAFVLIPAASGQEKAGESTVDPGSRLKVSFATGAGNAVNLELVKEDWLSGTFALTGGTRGGGSGERPIDLERQK
jgi:hypothetical protein